MDTFHLVFRECCFIQIGGNNCVNPANSRVFSTFHFLSNKESFVTYSPEGNAPELLGENEQNVSPLW